MNWKKIMQAAGAIVTLGALITICFGIQAYFAKASEVEELRAEVVLVAMRLEQKIDTDLLEALQKQKRDLEKYYRDNPPMPDVVREDIHRLERKIEELKRKLYKK